MTLVLKKVNTCIIFILLSFFISIVVNAQEVNYKVHALFIYHFTKHIDWPDNKKTGDFLIGVLGNSPIMAELESLAATKKVGSQNIVIKKITSEAEVSNCHIAFISAGKSGSLEEVLGTVGSKPVLIVTEKNGLGKKGACLNFIIQDDKLKFEINKQSIEAKKLKISGDLIKLGITL